MRRCLVLLALVAFAAVCAGPAWCEAQKADGDLAVKIYEFVTKELQEALYGGSEKSRNEKLAELAKEYAADVKKLKDLAAKGTGDAKKLQEALTAFTTNIAACSTCEHKYRNLIIDLVAFEECKKKSCKPVMAAWEEIAKLARPMKKSK